MFKPKTEFEQYKDEFHRLRERCCGEMYALSQEFKKLSDAFRGYSECDVVSFVVEEAINDLTKHRELIERSIKVLRLLFDEYEPVLKKFVELGGDPYSDVK